MLPSSVMVDIEGYNAHASTSKEPWRPTRYLEPSRPPQDEVIKVEQYEVAVKVAERWGGGVDFAGRAPKLLKPRRTVDYMAGMGRMKTLEKLRRNGRRRAPIMHPNPSDIIKLLMPSAYLDNPSSSICDVFVHSSMNKERCPISVARWSPDGRWCATGNQMGQFTLWNGCTFNFESLKQGHDHPIRAMAYTHSGSFFLSGDQSGALKYFSPKVSNLTTLQAHREACRAISFSPNDEKFATGGDDGAVKVWSFGAAAEEKVLSGHGWDVRCVEWHPTKGLLVSGSKDMLVKFWDPRSGKDLSTLHSHRAVVNDCKWSPNGNMVATAGGDGIVRLFDIRTFKELEPLKGHDKEVTSVAWHPTHNTLLSSGGMDGALFHWVLDSTEPSKPVSAVQYAHDQVIWTLDYHPLGYVLASGSKDYSTRFWCRARPAGGQERDRWHVGETASQQLGTWKQQVDDDDQDEEMALPGLGGSNQQPTSERQSAFPTNGSTTSSSAYGAPFGLPGLSSGGALPGLNGPSDSYSGGGGGGFSVPVASRGAPLPSQEDMLHTLGFAGERRGGGGQRGGGGRGGRGGGDGGGREGREGRPRRWGN